MPPALKKPWFLHSTKPLERISDCLECLRSTEAPMTSDTIGSHRMICRPINFKPLYLDPLSSLSLVLRSLCRGLRVNNYPIGVGCANGPRGVLQFLNRLCLIIQILESLACAKPMNRYQCPRFDRNNLLLRICCPGCEVIRSIILSADFFESLGWTSHDMLGLWDHEPLKWLLIKNGIADARHRLTSVDVKVPFG